ncbi:glycoside hydrolase family 3 C-terminal domain-containing protein, partial [Streptomyces canus]|uniref:glycoside hydrolase family 3 C-terminal domain-containing protein n=1 Tax=Streptomyces canus TaxID=58343 RepID=UPI0033AB51FB
MQGKYSTLPASELGADAVIQAFDPGMQGGRAIAELLLGRIEPSGRLPLSVPRHAGQLPVHRSQVRGLHGRLRRGPQLRDGVLLGTDNPESRCHVPGRTDCPGSTVKTVDHRASAAPQLWGG